MSSKRLALVAGVVLFLGPVRSQDVIFTNKTATFTNLEGRLFKDVQLSRGDWDGVIWRDGASGGRICYTNLHTSLLEAWGIPTNRTDIALARAQRKAISDAQYRAARFAAGQAELEARAKSNAAEAAAAPQRARDAQMLADADVIDKLERQITQAKADLRRKKAFVHDYNKANLYNDAAPTLYIQDSARLNLEEAEARLRRMQADFLFKYKNDFKAAGLTQSAPR